MYREGEMGGPSTVLVINSLLYKSTPVKALENFVQITLPESDQSFKTYLLKPSERGHVQEIKEGIENVIQSIVLFLSLSKQKVDGIGSIRNLNVKDSLRFSL